MPGSSLTCGHRADILNILQNPVEFEKCSLQGCGPVREPWFLGFLLPGLFFDWGTRGSLTVFSPNSVVWLSAAPVSRAVRWTIPRKGAVFEENVFPEPLSRMAFNQYTRIPYEGAAVTFSKPDNSFQLNPFSDEYSSMSLDKAPHLSEPQVFPCVK